MEDEYSFEVPIVELQQEIEALEIYAEDPDTKQKIERLQRKLARYKKEVYAKLTPWQVVLVARHPKRPYTLDYINMICDDFIEMHGDRRYADDPAIVGGMAFLGGDPVIVVGHQKGRTTKEKLYRNFGSAHPEGYRKALRIMRYAEKFNRPIICLVDTPGAYPGIGAEERGQAEAIAYNLREIYKLKVPIIVCIIGEGGSGGALALGIGDTILMLEYSIYSVISPEGCAAILWRDSEKKREAADNLHLTAQDWKKFNLIDDIIPEPLGGAHSDPEESGRILKARILSELQRLVAVPVDELLELRYQKFRKMGVFEEL
ncbi:MAG: acetyl-CoA carboxylase carboxyltransferase subunit alpha [Candidatus Fischerbacteria bacterium RBG_13_37_8]|uniref:Acetyl-coenzyme A carboxylase carboxyl transferase subunit alpha n=1 Tax=Candidatus Fischerbacteria bacterium RBG_13_37_8 TaxID=1817863 RepID=A0A1F5VDE7_9BACT|nr:MAG: acetyl-CoA carboxylase carboxyltransferase subunit alpha [Candidatus Fischerbacteria bacterium RBG_13_37_8]